jgi:hypothetical protein
MISPHVASTRSLPTQSGLRLSTRWVLESLPILIFFSLTLLILAHIHQAINGPTSLSSFSRRIYLMSNASLNACGWYGVGNQGCFGAFCGVWIRGDRGEFLQTFFHELGHTFNAQHSGNSAWEYGDSSSVMGSTSFRGCMDSSNAMTTGWAKPLASHYAEQTLPGVRYTYAIPVFEFNDTNTVRIFPNWTTPTWNQPDGSAGWMASTTPAYYLSMKRNVGFDDVVATQYQNKLLVHVTNRTDVYNPYNYKPLLINGAGMLPGEKV